MKKRLQCLLLTLALVATSFCVSCGKEDDIDTLKVNDGSAKAPAMTITLWGIKGDNTTDEAVAAVEDAMSAVTQSKFNTALKLNLFTKAEYKDALETRIAESAAQKEAEEAAEEQKEALAMLEGDKAVGDEDETEETVQEDVTSINELGLVEIIYPEPDPAQLDIFYIPDYDTYVEYADAEYLSMLDSELDTTGKRMKTYIHPNILSASKLNGVTYSIINNKPVGQYTYLLLNKALLDKYYYDADEIIEFDAADEFIMDIGANEPGIVPVLNTFEAPGVQYFTSDGSKSVVGSMLPSSAEKNQNSYGVPRVIFSANAYVSHLKQLKKYESLGYVGNGTAAPGEFAVGVIRGNAADAEKYSDKYEVKVLQKPYVNNDIYNDMFAISANTKDLTRSMQVLCELNTNSELRNIFGYGIEGTNFKLNSDGVVVKLNNDYDTPLNYTGNMFIAYPPEGSYPTVWEDCKAQNLEIADDPYFGFIYKDLVNTEMMAEIAKISTDYFRQLDAVSYAGFDAWVDKVNAELKANTAVSNYISFTEPGSLAFEYNEWFFALFPDAML